MASVEMTSSCSCVVELKMDNPGISNKPKRSSRNGRKTAPKTAAYDSAEFLNSPKAIQFYMEEVMESGDAQLITQALGVVARAKSMSEIARKSGLSRESLYRSLSPSGKPEFGTVMSVLKALDLGLSVKPRAIVKGSMRGSSAKKKKMLFNQRAALAYHIGRRA
jgi:probable addiction module antidote protein